MESIISLYKDGIVNTAAVLVVLTMGAALIEEYGFIINRMISTSIGG
ncbi:MAG: hypothetical protein ACI4E1_06340 [Lachnospira sp.]